MFKRRPSLFSKGAPPAAAVAASEGVKRRTSFFGGRGSSSTTSTALPSGVSTPYPTPSTPNGGSDLSRSESLPEVAPPAIRKRTSSEDSRSPSVRSSLEDSRRMEVESPEGDLTDEGEGREVLMGNGVSSSHHGRREGEPLLSSGGQVNGHAVSARPLSPTELTQREADAEQQDTLVPLPSSALTNPSASSTQPPSSTPPAPLANGTSPTPSPPTLLANGDLVHAPPLTSDPAEPQPISSPIPLPSPTTSTSPSTAHHTHHHSPPLAAPPPLRASTISALTAPPGGPAGVPKKAGKTFLGLGGGKAKREAAAAAALQAAAEAQRILDEMTPAQKVERAKQAERAHLLQTCMQLGLEIYDIAPDGHCLYAAIADQLWILRIIKEEENNPTTTRKAAAEYMLANPDSFMPFLVGVPADPNDEPEEGEDPAEPLEEDGLMTMKGYKRYCKRVQESGEWGGEPEILALSRAYNIPIHVIQSNHPRIVAHSPDPKANATLDAKAAKKIRAVRISYHRRLYGLGEHYNSLRKIQYQLTAFSAMVPM